MYFSCMPAFRFIPVSLPGFPASNLASKAKEQSHGEDQAVSYGRVQQQTALGPRGAPGTMYRYLPRPQQVRQNRGADQQYRGVFEKIYIFSPSINIDDGWIPVKKYIEEDLGVNTGDKAALRDIIQKQRKITETSKKLEMKKLYQVLIILDDYADSPQLHKAQNTEGPNDRLQADLINFSQNTRGKTKYGLVVMDVFTREGAVEPLQNKNAETVGRATKRAARELTGDHGNFVVTTDLGNKFATLDRELPKEAVHRTKRPEDRNWPRGWRARAGSGATTSSGRPGPTTRGPTRRCTARPRTWRGSRPRSSGSARQRRQVPAQQGPHRPAREGGGGRGRLPSADERGEELQPSVRRRAAAGGRGLHDRPQHGGARDPTEAGAAGAAGQRQRGGPADETQTGGCEAAGRLPGASARLAFLDIARAGGEFPEPAQALFLGLGSLQSRSLRHVFA